MASRRLKSVHTYLEEPTYERMEFQRRRLRRMSRSRFVEDAIIEKVERMEQLSPVHDAPNRPVSQTA